MTDEKDLNTSNRQNMENESKRVSERVETSGDPAIERDGGGNVVSIADQQEGSMNNGECGGNLTSEEQGRNPF